MEAKLKSAGLQQNLGALIPNTKDLKVIVDDEAGGYSYRYRHGLKTSEQDAILKRWGK